MPRVTLDLQNPAPGATPPSESGRSAVILAGGGSRRMGKEKALLEAGGESLIERSLARLAASFGELVVSVGPDGGSRGLREAVERFEARSERRVGLGVILGIREHNDRVGRVSTRDAANRASEDHPNERVPRVVGFEIVHAREVVGPGMGEVRRTHRHCPRPDRYRQFPP